MRNKIEEYHKIFEDHNNKAKCSLATLELYPTIKLPANFELLQQKFLYLAGLTPDVEVATIVLTDQKDKIETVYTKTGDRDSVYMPFLRSDQSRFLLNDKLNTIVGFHSHPVDTTGLNFSQEDKDLFAQQTELIRIFLFPLLYSGKMKPLSIYDVIGDIHGLFSWKGYKFSEAGGLLIPTEISKTITLPTKKHDLINEKIFSY